MPRKPRLLVDGGYYHLIARGNNQLFIFETVNGYSHFKKLIMTAKHKFRWQIYHYCLMGNHFHILARIEKGTDLPRIMQFLLFEYSRWYRKQCTYSGHLWQGRYKSPLIEAESYFLECGRYIERNPVRAGVTQHAGDYPWSSFAHYGMGILDPLLDEDPYYASLGRTSRERCESYKDYVDLVEGPYDGLVDKILYEAHF